MPTIIEGLKVTIAGTELKKLAQTRAAFHLERAKFYTKTKSQLPDDDAAVAASNSGKRPEEMMQERIRTHNQEASEFVFIADHLDIKAKYILDRTDLYRLGVVTFSQTWR